MPTSDDGDISLGPDGIVGLVYREGNLTREKKIHVHDSVHQDSEHAPLCHLPRSDVTRYSTQTSSLQSHLSPLTERTELGPSSMLIIYTPYCRTSVE
jgi:hypothetical protein